MAGGSKRCAYKVLAVPRDADAAALKKAYKKAALKYHPDRHSTDDEKDQKAAEELFKEAAGAYEVLSDSNNRATYDACGWAGLEGGAPPPGRGPGGMGRAGFGAGAPGHFVFGSGGGQNADPMKLFASMFGGMPGGMGGMGAMGGTGGMSMNERAREAGMGRSSFESLLYGGAAAAAAGGGGSRKRGRPAAPGELQSGTQVVAHGLKAEQMNGAHGTVGGRGTAGRYTVAFPTLGKSLSLKRANLFCVGQRVSLAGLRSQPELNGSSGSIVGVKPAGNSAARALGGTDRYLVRLNAGTTGSFKKECVELQCGAKVSVDGLVSAKFNGLVGEVLSLDRSAGRYVVALEGGHGQLKLKPENLTV